MTTKGVLAVLIALGSAGMALAQEREATERENGQVQLTLAQSPDEAQISRLELELGLSDRLQFRAEVPISARPGQNLGIGLAYDFSREGHFSLGAGFELQPAEPSDLSLRFEGGMVLGKGEILSELEVGVGSERDATFELAGAPKGSNWRGTLTLRHDAGASEVRITPGVAWKVHGVWLGMGVALPSASASKTSLVVTTSFDF